MNKKDFKHWLTNLNVSQLLLEIKTNSTKMQQRYKHIGEVSSLCKLNELIVKELRSRL